MFEYADCCWKQIVCCWKFAGDWMQQFEFCDNASFWDSAFIRYSVFHDLRWPKYFEFKLNLSLINSLSLKRRLFLSRLIAISIISKFNWLIAKTSWLKALYIIAFFFFSPRPDFIFRMSSWISLWILLKSFFGLEFRWMQSISSTSLIPSTNLSTNQSGRFDFCFDDWRTYLVFLQFQTYQSTRWTVHPSTCHKLSWAVVRTASCTVRRQISVHSSKVITLIKRPNPWDGRSELKFWFVVNMDVWTVRRWPSSSVEAWVELL